jgi:hypothetical protein
MSTEQNKAIVRRFMSELFADGKPGVIDEVLGPSYVNRALGADLEAFRGFLPEITSLPVRRLDIEDLVAEGDAVVARFTLELGNAAGETVSARGMTYYRLANGRIVEDEPITTPDLVQELRKLLPSPVAS